MKSRGTPLSWQLLKSVLSIYFIITLVVTLTQMAIEYIHARDMIQSELASTERTFYPALSTALWELNAEQLEAIQRGIIGLPTISSLRIVDTSGRELNKIEGGNEAPAFGTSIRHTFPVTYHFGGEDVPLANVTFEASSNVVLKRVELGYRMILISAVIKSAALTLLFVWVFRRILAQPLKQLSDAVESIDIDSLATTKLDFRQPESNELTKLERAFNHMLARLNEERNRHEASLTSMNRNLESLVEKRTEELRAANEHLEQLVRTDTLTGAANRRHFIERVNLEIERTRRNGALLSLLMVDLDHFKQINDTWGHAGGDDVLRGFTAVAESHLRGTDLFARLGGEEFAILLPDTDLAGAAEVARRILSSAAQHPIDSVSGKIRYSTSIGVATLRSADLHYEPLLKRADDALYRAKTLGRGRVELEEPQRQNASA